MQIHRKNGITHKARRSKIEKANIPSAKSEHSFSESEHSSESEHFIITDKQYFNQMRIIVTHLTCEIL
jgi:hypothetical protein